MKKFPYKDAKAMVRKICASAAAGEFDAREKFISMMDQHPDIAVQGYNPYGKIFFWNEASVQVYGHSEAEAVNRDLFDLILPPEMRTFARDMVTCGVKTGRMPESGACDLIHRDGGLVSVYSGHLVFRWKSGTPEFYCLDVPLDTDTVS